MSKKSITIGTTIICPNLDNMMVSGKVEHIRDNTVIIRDNDGETHVILKKTIEKNDISIGTDAMPVATPYKKNKIPNYKEMPDVNTRQ